MYSVFCRQGIEEKERKEVQSIYSPFLQPSEPFRDSPSYSVARYPDIQMSRYPDTLARRILSMPGTLDMCAVGLWHGT